MTDDVAVRIEHVSKTFRLPHDKQNSIKGGLINLLKGGKRTYETQDVLNDVSFEIKKGEFFGIVGRNGSGKSTLLKILAGIYMPTEGNVRINGSLTPFIELGVGFNPELTGRENVFLNGALLGFSREEMTAMYDDIVRFAELERFMDQKLKNFSSGMQVRLAFSIAIRAQGDILVLDEVLAVGDAAFQKKCYDYFMELKENKKTVILVTHDMAAVKEFCTRAVLIESGDLKEVGEPDKIANQYTVDNFGAGSSAVNDTNKMLNNGVEKLEIRLKKSVFSQSDELEFDVVYRLETEKKIDIGISILHRGVSLIEQNTKSIKLSSLPTKDHILHYAIPLHVLNPGSYTIDVAVFDKATFTLSAFNTQAATFLVKDLGDRRYGLINHKGEWKS